MGGGNSLRSIVYFVNWAIYGRAHNPQDLPVQNLTHILYAFANVRPESGDVYLTDPWSDTDKHYPSDSWNDVGTNLYGCLKQLFLLKKRNRRLKVLLSIGGWTYSSNFAGPARTAAGRARFASTAVQLLEDLGFDGLDVDWEYPQTGEQAADLVALLRELRRALDAAAAKRQGGEDVVRFVLSVACPAGAQNYEKLRIGEMDACLDFWNLMAYDYAGSWDRTAGHQANLFQDKKRPETTPFSTERAVEYYASHGVDRNKIVLGMPLYGRAFKDTDGPGHSFNGVGEGSFEQGVWDYKVLPHDGAQEFHDKEIGASWSHHPGSKTMVSYDSVAVVGQKAEYVKRKGLGGGMWWESSGDRKVGEGSLVEAFVGGIGGSGKLDDARNCLEYPESKFENLRKGFPGEE